MTALGLVAATASSAQPVRVDWSGRAYIDYSYLIASDDPRAEGENGFDYRRIYLTANAALGEGFQARVRLEANGRSTTLQGRPAPFVKDAWLRWDYAPSGHRATLGVQPPPVFTVAEDVWGYRSLDATLLDRTGVRSSRDFGLQFEGPVGGEDAAVRYAVMVGNANGVEPEDAGERGKRAYAQLQFVPEGPLRATLGADYGEEAPAEGVGQSSARVSAFVGAVTDRVRAGVEAFYVRDASEGVPSVDGTGVSAFAVVGLGARTSLVGRYDYADGDRDVLGDIQLGPPEHYGLAAVAYRPTPAVSLMPNVQVWVRDGADATVLGRFTAAFQF